MRFGPFQLRSMILAGMLAGSMSVSSGALGGTAHSPSVNPSPSVDAARNASAAATQSAVRDARDRAYQLRRGPSHRTKTGHHWYTPDWR